MEFLTRENRVLPDHVRREFEDYLKCGRLENGFLLEHRGKVIGAESGIRADTSVVMNRDLGPFVIDSFVQRPIGQLLIRQLILAMSAVTKRLVVGSATTTQGDAGHREAGSPIGLLAHRDYFRREII